MRIALCSVSLLCCGLLLADPPKVTNAEPPLAVSIDQLVQKYKDAVAAEAKAHQGTADALKAVQDEQTRIGKLIADAGIQPPAPPAPADPLVSALQQAYKDDGGTPAQLSTLIQFYGSLVSTIDNPANATTGGLFTVLKTARQAIIPDAQLAKTRAVVDASVIATAAIPQTSSVPLTDAMRAAMKAQFEKVVGILGTFGGSK